MPASGVTPLALIEEHGSNVWFERDTAALWADVKPADWEGPEPDGKSMDTLDVWIDSGSSSRSVIMQRPELHHAEKEGVENWQGDVYLEVATSIAVGSKALLLSLAGNGAPPFKTVLTHGFMVDADREKFQEQTGPRRLC